MTISSGVDSRVRPEVLRKLSPLEGLVDAVDETNGFNFSLVVSFKGRIEHSRWIAAFAQLQQRHPFLRAGLNRDDTLAPFLYRAEGISFPLVFQERSSSTQWERVVEAHIGEPFVGAPLVRATLLDDAAGCDLIFTAHHVILDGMGAVALLGDLMAALAGETLTALPVPLSAEEHLRKRRLAMPAHATAASRDAEEWAKFLATRPVKVFRRHTGTRRPMVRSLCVSLDETARWIACARRHEVTLSALLMAAMAAAMRELMPALKRSDVIISVPVDARPHMGNEKDGVFCVTNPRVFCLPPEEEIWKSAREVRTQLRRFHGLEAAEAYLSGIAALMDAKLDRTTLVSVVAGQFGSDATLTNLKQVDFRKLPEGLSVEAVWGPAVPTPVADTFVIGAATANGALHLVYTTYSPLAGLLESVRAIVARGCAEA